MKEVIVVLIGLGCGLAGYRYGLRARMHQWEKWPQWLIAVVAGVTGYAISTILIFQLWTPLKAGLIVGLVSGLMISGAAALTEKGMTLQRFATLNGSFVALGLLSAAFFPF